MIFSKVFKSNPIQKIELTVAKGQNNDAIAFGPASVINGSVTLFLNKRIRAESISVVFKCKEQEGKSDQTTLFSVESSIWQPKRESDSYIEPGNHMYLFAIQLPSSVNYPPTITKDYLGHRIEYSLQGFLDYYADNKVSEKKSTSKIALTYLPLVAFNKTTYPQYGQRPNKTVRMEKEHEYVEVTASLANPSACPGDLCSVKLYTQNHSSSSIHQVRIILLSTVTTLDSANVPSSLSGPRYQHKQRQLVNEIFYVSIPKQSTNITSVCPFRVPSYCVPTTQSHYGKHLEISYEVFVVIPAFGNKLETNDTIAQLLFNSQQQVIRLPLFMSTIPYYSHAASAITHSSSVNNTATLPQLQIPFANEPNNMDTPTFILHESPLPSPNAYSLSDGSYCNWSPGSPVAVEDHSADDLPTTLSAWAHTSPVEDATGHLMVPPIGGGSFPSQSSSTTATSPRRSLSSHSTTSVA
ncbi:hypothetical protein BDF20DRAFT_986320 [Mycotypha africana]|uniref:uncharacterized protein n=1 Tax=Mycotypha africana TaxID=64632 RepID=UPI0022FFFE6F|nr:uncharacterized protein BDF20DRAFT_986320 [Mycotypha africana]KAI8984434.1 hypothetical protein BDF20DRAFT_986320 [Mycotypha africana]